MGGFSVDLSKFGWFPDELPSEEALVAAQAGEVEVKEESE
jgi:hypothetical protein